MSCATNKAAGLTLIVLIGAVQALAQNALTLVTVDANANRHPINPNIYGIAYGAASDISKLNVSLNRWGGNSTSRYNLRIPRHENHHSELKKIIVPR